MTRAAAEAGFCREAKPWRRHALVDPGHPERQVSARPKSRRLAEWRRWSARRPHKPQVAGSSPASATISAFRRPPGTRKARRAWPVAVPQDAILRLRLEASRRETNPVRCRGQMGRVHSGPANGLPIPIPDAPGSSRGAARVDPDVWTSGVGSNRTPPRNQISCRRKSRRKGERNGIEDRTHW